MTMSSSLLNVLTHDTACGDESMKSAAHSRDLNSADGTRALLCTGLISGEKLKFLVEVLSSE
ncbi:hypothetical protein L195_g008223 [Trifolium pratense]|uniref:Uncharacterized protein n=1 Tax=Trifolium pratense TaxID=57577 RepID=A0A2K3P8J7_TRIPR|nr:hypothetical protein L195_g008223 [Trifolium pratense]